MNQKGQWTMREILKLLLRGWYTRIWCKRSSILDCFVLTIFICSASLMAASQNKIPKAKKVSKKVEKMTTLEKRAANKQAEEEALSSLKTVSGTISGIYGLMISIEYKRDTDMAFYIEDDTVYNRVKDIKGLKVGDRVSAKYEEYVWDEVEGLQRKKKILKEISFISPKPKGLVSKEISGNY